jgi:hypothetical protein
MAVQRPSIFACSSVRNASLPSPAFGERSHRSLARLGVPARGSSAADLTTRYIPSHTPSLERDIVAEAIQKLADLDDVAKAISIAPGMLSAELNTLANELIVGEEEDR